VIGVLKQQRRMRRFVHRGLREVAVERALAVTAYLTIALASGHSMRAWIEPPMFGGS
jgi:hypothetical protein